ncbi:MAG: hypothetical protein LBS19_16785 [Clostridiales bacterium]|nr:hypothetical protein [Clostridiales bacterium]
MRTIDNRPYTHHTGAVIPGLTRDPMRLRVKPAMTGCGYENRATSGQTIAGD